MSKLLSLALVLALALTGWCDVHAAPDQGPIPVSAADASWGDADAPVTIVHFSDLQCPFCKRSFDTVEALQTKYGPKKLRVVFKHFPLAFHKQAHDAALAAVAIKNKSGDAAAWRYIAAAYEHLPGKDDQFAVLAAASAAGVSKSAIAGRNADAIGAKVEEDIALGKKIGVRGTPATFVNGKMLSGAQPQEKFEEAIDEQLREAAKLRSNKGVSLLLTKKNFVMPAPPTPTPSAGPDASSQDVWKVPVGRAPVRGDRNALVTLVVFSEFQCPFCGRLVPTLDELSKKYGRDLRIAFKNHVLPFHKDALPAAQLAMEAYARGGHAAFWKAHDILFQNQKALSEADLEGYAAMVPLSPALAMQAVRSNKHQRLIDDDEELAADVGARGTPISFINGRKLTGSQPLDKFETVIDEELAKAKKLVAGGVAASRVYDHIIAKGKSDEPERKKVAPPGKHTPILGTAGAKVTIQVFSDFQCPFCQRAKPTLDQVLKEYPGKVRIAFHHRPLAFHKEAMAAHRAAVEAQRQGGDKAFWQMHDKIFENSRDLSHATLMGYAQDIGLDTRAFASALTSDQHDARISADVDMAEAADINGTPHFIINGYSISGAQPFSAFKRIIDKALAGK